MELENQVALMREEYQRQVTEVKDLRERVTSLQDHNKTLLSDLNKTKSEYEAFVNAYKKESNLLKRFQEDLHLLQQENRELRSKAKATQVDGKLKSEIRKLMKKSPKRRAKKSPDPVSP